MVSKVVVKKMAQKSDILYECVTLIYKINNTSHNGKSERIDILLN